MNYLSIVGTVLGIIASVATIIDIWFKTKRK